MEYPDLHRLLVMDVFHLKSRIAIYTQTSSGEVIAFLFRGQFNILSDLYFAPRLPRSNGRYFVRRVVDDQKIADCLQIGSDGSIQGITTRKSPVSKLRRITPLDKIISRSGNFYLASLTDFITKIVGDSTIVVDIKPLLQTILQQDSIPVSELDFRAFLRLLGDEERIVRNQEGNYGRILLDNGWLTYRAIWSDDQTPHRGQFRLLEVEIIFPKWKLTHLLPSLNSLDKYFRPHFVPNGIYSD